MQVRPIFPASYSKLSTYETCPDKLKYRYVLGLQESKGPAAERGSALHASAEGFVKGEKTTIRAELKPIVSALKNAKKMGSMAERPIALARGLEKAVDWKSPEAYIRMYLDSHYENKGAIYIDEWKSGKVYDDHVDQRKIYILGALAAYPKAREAVAITHYIDQKGRPEETRATRQHAKLIAWHFNERLEVMERDTTYGPRPGFYCRWCPYSRWKGGPCRAG